MRTQFWAAGAAALLAASVLSASHVAAAAAADSGDACAAAGEGRFKSANHDRCEGFWNVYASIPQGDVWAYENKDGTDRHAAAIQARIDRQAEAVQAALRRCRITSYESYAGWFDNFDGNLVVVHSRPYRTAAAANAELTAAKRCGVRGYTKFSPYQIVGRD